MILTFLGTRGNTIARSRLHARHSALLVQTRRGRVMFDCGADWLGRLGKIAPNAIFLTHAHPDHADGLCEGAPCPVYASKQTWASISNFPVSNRRTLTKGRAHLICGLQIRAFPVIHSLLAPAVGYRVEADGACLFYAPDLVAIADPKPALMGIDLYVGDGASPTRPLVRRRDHALFGHTTIHAQVGWCAKYGVVNAIFTHCGTSIVAADGRTTAALVRRMGKAVGVRARIATDGLKIELPPPRARAPPPKRR